MPGVPQQSNLHELIKGPSAALVMVQNLRFGSIAALNGWAQANLDDDEGNEPMRKLQLKGWHSSARMLGLLQVS